MDIRITPAPLRGTVPAPPSKSAAHRALICAALAPGESVLGGVALSQDIEATVGAARALGARVEQSGGVLHVTGPLAPGPACVIDCGESGSTERFFVPIAAALGREAVFTGRGRLPERPIGPLADVMERHGARFSRRDGMPFTVSGTLAPGIYELPGDVSSQYITGLLFALALLEGPSEIRLTTRLESAGYVGMTLQALARSGIAAGRTAAGFAVRGGQTFLPRSDQIEGDWSNGAFWLCARFLGADVACTGLDPGSAQGDREAAALLARFGEEGDIAVDCAPVPDLVPALCAAAAGRRGTTRFRNAARLRLKECDRLSAMANCLRALGGQAEEAPDALTVHGTGALGGGAADGCGDHRVVMAAATMAVICRSPVTIRDAQAVAKSYPDYFEQYKALGGKIDVL